MNFLIADLPAFIVHAQRTYGFFVATELSFHQMLNVNPHYAQLNLRRIIRTVQSYKILE